MDSKKAEKAKKRLEELRKKALEEEEKNDSEHEEKQEIPREAFRKNLGCGGWFIVNLVFLIHEWI